MKRALPPGFQKKIDILAYYQILGGVLGVGLMIYLVAQTGTITGGLLLIIVFAFALYGYSIYCGNLLRINQIDKGLFLSKINQLLQIIEFAIAGYAYKYVSGGSLMVELDVTNGLNFHFNLAPSSFQLSVNKDHELMVVGVNLLAIYVAYYITRMEERIDEYNMLINFPADAANEAEQTDVSN